MNKFIDRLLNEALSTDEEIEIVKYGLKRFIMFICSVIVVALLGILFKKVFAIAIFMCLFIPLRVFAGGFHAGSLKACAVISLIFIINILVIIKWMEITELFCMIMWIVVLGATLIIVCLAPIDTENKWLNRREKNVFGIVAKIVTGLEIIVAILLWSFYREYWVLPILSITSEALFLSMQHIENICKKKRKANDI